MDEQEKPFGTADIVILMLVSGVSDVADLATDFLFPVPIIGQIVFVGNSLIISPIVWAIIQLWFIMKTGGSRASLLAVAGGLGNVANVPGSETITTAIAIALANRPKIAGLAVTAGTAIATGGAGMAAAGAAGGEIAAGVETAGAVEAGGAKMTGVKAGGAAGREAWEEAGAGTSEQAPEKEISGKEFGEIPTPFEELERLTGPEGVTENTEKNEIDLRKTT